MRSADPKSLRQLLLTARYAYDADHASTVYVQLFFTVFERLTHPGYKSLTIADREQLLARPSFDARVQALLETLHDLLDTLDARISRVEERIDSTEVVQKLQAGLLSTLQSQMENMRHAQDIKTTITYGERFVTSIDIPPLVEHLSRREETVEDLKRQVLAHTWTAFHGQSSCGKTQLVVLLVEAMKQPCLWIRLHHDRSCQENRSRLDAACLEQLGTPAQDSLYRWYKQVIESLGQRGLLVLDGLPRLQGQDLLSESLRSLLTACKATGVSMVSTSPHSLPERVEFSTFLMAQQMRTPRGREWLRFGQDQAAKFWLLKQNYENRVITREHLWEDLGREPTEDEIDESILQLAESLERDELMVNLSLDHEILGMIMPAPDLIPLIGKMNWTLLEAPVGQSFILTDDPLVRLDPLNPDGPAGWCSSPNVEATMPLDPH